MSHVMLESVIRMPFEVAMGDHFSRLQFYQRAQQALSELEALQSKIAEQHAPTAWLNEETGDVISSELKADAPEMLKGYDVPLYKCPEFSCQGLLDGSECNGVAIALIKEMDAIGLDINAYESADKALGDLIDWHVSVAVDSRVNGGWQLVPIEPTAEMCDAADFEGEFSFSAFEQAEGFWSAMLAAAPKYKWSKE